MKNPIQSRETSSTPEGAHSVHFLTYAVIISPKSLQETLQVLCQVATPAECSEKEAAFIAKMQVG
jgi:hypothetical protein